jgi:actin-like ATPase involved in cell morphogenesis
MAKQNFSALIGKAKETQINTPIQKVVLVKEKKEEVLFSLHIPVDKLKALKIKSAEENKSLKELINNAIDNLYFK